MSKIHRQSTDDRHRPLCKRRFSKINSQDFEIASSDEIFYQIASDQPEYVCKDCFKAPRETFTFYVENRLDKKETLGFDEIKKRYTEWMDTDPDSGGTIMSPRNSVLLFVASKDGLNATMDSVDIDRLSVQLWESKKKAK